MRIETFGILAVICFVVSCAVGFLIAKVQDAREQRHVHRPVTAKTTATTAIPSVARDPSQVNGSMPGNAAHVQPPSDADTEERYRQHLSYLINRTKSRGHSRYFNQYVNRCREEAAAAYPKGAAAARKKDIAAGGLLAVIFGAFEIFG